MKMRTNIITNLYVIILIGMSNVNSQNCSMTYRGNSGVVNANYMPNHTCYYNIITPYPRSMNLILSWDVFNVIGKMPTCYSGSVVTVSMGCGSQQRNYVDLCGNDGTLPNDIMSEDNCIQIKSIRRGLEQQSFRLKYTFTHKDLDETIHNCQSVRSYYSRSFDLREDEGEVTNPGGDGVCHWEIDIFIDEDLEIKLEGGLFDCDKYTHNSLIIRVPGKPDFYYCGQNGPLTKTYEDISSNVEVIYKQGPFKTPKLRFSYKIKKGRLDGLAIFGIVFGLMVFIAIVISVTGSYFLWCRQKNKNQSRSVATATSATQEPVSQENPQSLRVFPEELSRVELPTIDIANKKLNSPQKYKDQNTGTDSAGKNVYNGDLPPPYEDVIRYENL